MNYYNENDPYASKWLSNLIIAGLIPAGYVDERSIVAVQSEDLADYTQCHFFAGIAGWSEALRLAGWPPDWPIWTASCPCQPLSGAGQRKGHADERHLWPAFYRLVDQCRPATIFGEQVASKDGREWFAGVRADLEAIGYACGCADLCSAGVGAPHIRQRLHWVAYARYDVGSAWAARGKRQSSTSVSEGARSHCADAQGLADAHGWHASAEGLQRGGEHGQFAEDYGASEGLANPSSTGTGRNSGSSDGAQAPGEGEWLEPWNRVRDTPQSCGAVGAQGLADAEYMGRRSRRPAAAGEAAGGRPSGDATGRGPYAEGLGDATSQGLQVSERDGGVQAGVDRSRPWQDAFRTSALCVPWNGRTIAIGCTDGWRRISAQPSAFPLAHGLPKGMGRGRAYLEALAALPPEVQGNRIGRLRGYGNAINPHLAAEFIKAAWECRP